MPASHLTQGFTTVFQGLRLLKEPGIRRFVAIPFTINLFVFSGLIWFGMGQFEHLMDWLLPKEGWFSWLQWLRYLLWPLFALTAVLVVFFTFTVLANLMAAPFNGLLAEKVERYLGGSPLPGRPLWQEVPIALSSEMRKLSYFLIRALPLLILFLIPGLNLAAPLLWGLFSAWFLSIEYGDFPMANHRLAFPDQHARLKSRRLLALGFGGGVTLLMMIPILNFFAMPAGVAGATLLWHRHLRDTASTAPTAIRENANH
jgi:CysZ protein